MPPRTLTRIKDRIRDALYAFRPHRRKPKDEEPPAPALVLDPSPDTPPVLSVKKKLYVPEINIVTLPVRSKSPDTLGNLIRLDNVLRVTGEPLTPDVVEFLEAHIGPLADKKEIRATAEIFFKPPQGLPPQVAELEDHTNVV